MIKMGLNQSFFSVFSLQMFKLCLAAFSSKPTSWTWEGSSYPSRTSVTSESLTPTTSTWQAGPLLQRLQPSDNRSLSFTIRTRRLTMSRTRGWLPSQKLTIAGNTWKMSFFENWQALSLKVRMSGLCYVHFFWRPDVKLISAWSDSVFRVFFS